HAERRSRYPSTKTDAGGVFKFGQLPKRDVTLRVHAAGFAPQQATVKIGDAPAAGDFKLESPQVIRGRVVDAAGKPVAGANVIGDGFLGYLNARTGADGRFTFEGPLEGGQ